MTSRWLNRFSRAIWLQVSFIGLAATPLSFAQVTAADISPPDEVQWVDVLRLAHEASPRMALTRLDIAKAEADRRAAAALPNPSLSYGYERPSGGKPLFEGIRQESYGLELPLPKIGLRGARIRAAQADLDAALSSVQASANSLAADAGAAFINLLDMQNRVVLLAVAEDELMRLRDIVAARHASGVASRYELLRVDVEMSAWQSKLAESRAELSAEQGNLATLLGFPGWQPTARGTLEGVMDLLRPSASARDVAAHPMLRAAEAQETAAQARVREAERDRLPELALAYERNATSAPFGASDTLSLTVEVPIGDSRAGALGRARAEAMSASLQRQLVEIELGNALRQQTVLVEQRRRILEGFEQQVLQKLPELKGMADDAYRLGRSSITELLDAARTRYETQLDHSALSAQLAQAKLRLAAVRGELRAIAE